jgi:hypothetical protein
LPNTNTHAAVAVAGLPQGRGVVLRLVVAGAAGGAQEVLAAVVAGVQVVDLWLGRLAPLPKAMDLYGDNTLAGGNLDRVLWRRTVLAAL